MFINPHPLLHGALAINPFDSFKLIVFNGHDADLGSTTRLSNMAKLFSIVFMLSFCLVRGAFAQNASPEMQKLLDARDDARCRSFGAKPGTSVYVNCRLKMQVMHGQSVQSMQPQAQTPSSTESRTVCVTVPLFNTVATRCRQVTN